MTNYKVYDKTKDKIDWQIIGGFIFNSLLAFGFWHYRNTNEFPINLIIGGIGIALGIFVGYFFVRVLLHIIDTRPFLSLNDYGMLIRPTVLFVFFLSWDEIDEISLSKSNSGMKNIYIELKNPFVFCERYSGIKYLFIRKSLNGLIVIPSKVITEETINHLLSHDLFKEKYKI
jgi:hypothetical protein